MYHEIICGVIGLIGISYIRGGGGVVVMLYNYEGWNRRNVILCYTGWGGGWVGKKILILELYNLWTIPYDNRKKVSCNQASVKQKTLGL